MLQYKKSANKGVLQPVMMLGLSRIETVFNSYGYAAVITSTDDSFHKVGSLHYVGLAVDLRIKHIQLEVIESLFDDVVKVLDSLSEHFQAILETDHIHVEYDRRR